MSALAREGHQSSSLFGHLSDAKRNGREPESPVEKSLDNPRRRSRKSRGNSKSRLLHAICRKRNRDSRHPQIQSLILQRDPGTKQSPEFTEIHTSQPSGRRLGKIRQNPNNNNLQKTSIRSPFLRATGKQRSIAPTKKRRPRMAPQINPTRAVSQPVQDHVKHTHLMTTLTQKITPWT